jgi:hypothetical protein
MENTNMGITALLVVALILSGVGIYLCAVIISILPKKRKSKRRVVATVRQIQIWFEGWYVIAVWTDILTGKSYTFRSPPIELHLKQRLGDRVVVDFDPGHPEQYRMRL